MSRTVKSVLLALAAAALTAPAFADPSRATVSVKIPYSDLNLESEAGAMTAIRRIEQAAVRVCGNRPVLHQIRATQAYRACLDDVTQKAVVAIGSPTVLALAARMSPTTVASR